MCLIYKELDLKDLPTSNPFSENVPSPVGPPIPECILIESPAAHQYPAWTDLRRFPSMMARDKGTTLIIQSRSQAKDNESVAKMAQEKALMSTTLETIQPKGQGAPINNVRILRRRPQGLTIQTA